MRKLIVFLFFSLFVSLAISSCTQKVSSSCSYTDENSYMPPVGAVKKYVVVVHDTVPADKANGIFDSLAEWSKITNGAVVYEVIYKHFDINKEPSEGELEIYLGPPDPNGKFIGMANWWNADSSGRPSRCIIWIDSTLNKKLNFLVSLHETGHCLGLGHTPETVSEESIMFPEISDVGDSPTCYDKRAVCKIWNCDLSCNN